MEGLSLLCYSTGLSTGEYAKLKKSLNKLNIACYNLCNTNYIIVTNLNTLSRFDSTNFKLEPLGYVIRNMFIDLATFEKLFKEISIAVEVKKYINPSISHTALITPNLIQYIIYNAYLNPAYKK